MISGRIRLVLAAAVLIPLAGFGWLGSKGSKQQQQREPMGERWTSSKQCQQCHPQVFAEWQGSHHQIAFLNPEVRKLSDDFRNKECQACHLPRPVFVTGLGNRTLPRVTRPDEGVDCLSCHLSADGTILARSSRPDAPCTPRADPGVVSVDLCASCHNQHKTSDQWRESSFAKQSIDCAACHMQEVARPGTVSGKGRSHVFHGAHHEPMLQKASTLSVAREGDELIVTLANVGAGHNFPTEERHRAVDIEARFLGAAGTDGTSTEEWTRLFRFRQPYLNEPGESTQLPAGKTHVQRVAIPRHAKRAVVRLWYRLNPFATDAQSTLLVEKGIDL